MGNEGEMLIKREYLDGKYTLLFDSSFLILLFVISLDNFYFLSLFYPIFVEELMLSF